MNNMIDVAHAVFPKHSPGRLTTRGKFGTAVFSDVTPSSSPVNSRECTSNASLS